MSTKYGNFTSPSNPGVRPDLLSFTLLNVDRLYVSRMREVTALDKYVGATKNFHPDGLYSTEIFGYVGSEARDKTFAYINLHTEILSPLYALTLFELKQLYRDVMSGGRYAVWNEVTKDFDTASPGDPGADTGYSFFMSHLAELKPKKTQSLRRGQSLEIIDKYRMIASSPYVLVPPAGIRDLEIKEGQREVEDDVNTFYRRLISISRTIPNLGTGKKNKLTDSARWRMQQTFNDIYRYYFDTFNGKTGMLRGKWTKRNLVNGTRNVISSMDASSPVMDRPDEVRPTDTYVGMFQGMKSILPVAIYQTRTRYLSKLDAGNGNLFLIDPKTLKRKMVSVKPKEYDSVVTDEGIEKLINGFLDLHDKHSPYMIGNYYGALIYEDGKHFKVFYDIEELPDGWDRKKVKPISHAELLYLSGYDVWNEYYMLVTRYPVTGEDSTYPSTIRLTTTASTSMRYEYEDDWSQLKEKPAIDFPDRTIDEFVNSMAPHPSHLKALGAD